MFTRVLVANRGEIAARIMRTLKSLGIHSVAVYADVDRYSEHVLCADESVALVGDSAAETYLNSGKILAAAQQTGAEAIIPGYGFLSENAEFAEACAEVGIVFVGPTPTQMRQFGLKHAARELAEQAGVPLAPGSGLLTSLDEALQVAESLGYPVMLKSTAGGGGIGLMRCDDAAALQGAYESVQRLGQSYFNDSGVFLERFVAKARHVEVQIVGDGRGQVVALGERDCSLQRRNQKVVEETPAPNLPESTRKALHESAVQLGKLVDYQSVGTVEYIYDEARDEFYFLEVNTRLQVEHPVTEQVTGLDLVEWMIKIAAGESPDLSQPLPVPSGASMEVRIYAEDPLKRFQPSPGELTDVFWPEALARIDTWVTTGTQVSPHYDPMLAKLIVTGADREDALYKLQQALAETRLSGIATNLDYLRQVVASDTFKQGKVSTRWLDDFRYQPQVIEVLQPGTYTTVQDYPGRVGYWDIGVPPSGPMDDFAFRLANRIVGNPANAAGLECTIQSPSLKFHTDAVVALAGAPCDAMLDDQPVPGGVPVTVNAGQVLTIAKAQRGCRTYLAVRGGLDVPVYLGSRSTFALGQFGGHGGRPLRQGDMLPIAVLDEASSLPPQAAAPGLLPDYPSQWVIGVLYGPHGAPDFFTQESIDTFFASEWEVHYNSNRLGIRLNGPKPSFTRTDGGEAGLHPSNIHDCEYAIGSINFTGDMPVILTRDGPSLGGFVCPVTIAKAELWKVGQVKPGDTIRFVPITNATAEALVVAQDQAIETLQPLCLVDWETPVLAPRDGLSATLLAHLPATEARPEVSYRQAGDQYILMEYGPNVLDLAVRLRIHALMEAIRAQQPAGLLELAPGVRSLQLRYDARQLSQGDLVAFLLTLEDRLPPSDQISVPSRVVHLPMAFEDSATLDAVARYRQSVRDTAPWLPNNVDFIQRINGLASRDTVSDIVYQARYLVLGLGDVYLGAPCAVPLDPRHRLLTSKYNPARTYTAEGTVGIGGVYMCIYGMDSPGGYQLVGRTLPIWNKHLKNPQFAAGAPWLLRFFDQVCFYPVSEADLDRMRDDFRAGQLTIHIEETTFDLASHESFLHEHSDAIREFRQRQQEAFQREVARWQETEAVALEKLQAADAQAPDVSLLDDDAHVVSAEIAGSIWKLLVEPGATVSEGEPLLIVEAMKMEFAVHAPVSGRVSQVFCQPGKTISAGEPLASIDALETESMS